MTHTWKPALPDGVFALGGKEAPVIEEKQVNELGTKVSELVAAYDFSSRKLKPLTGKKGIEWPTC